MCHFRWQEVSEETDRTKGCKIHFPFRSLSNEIAKVSEGECGVFVSKQKEGKWGNKIHFLSLYAVFS